VIPLLLRKISFNFNHKIRHAREIGSLPQAYPPLWKRPPRLQHTARRIDDEAHDGLYDANRDKLRLQPLCRKAAIQQDRAFE
jgi:hypothetical protein